MTRVYTHGTWIVKPGREDEFVAAWRELAEWTRALIPEARGTLLRDREEPNRFHSFGPWTSEEVVDGWRGDPGFQERIEKIRVFVESFEPRLMDPVVEMNDR
jgi:quinol monooxygenase YgiN